MCFVVPNKVKKKTARRDIICYKDMKIIGKALNSRICIADDPYVFGKTYEANDYIGKDRALSVRCFVSLYSKKYVIDVGFHSWDTLSSEANVLCIIPKGAEYYHNRELKRYVSNKIKFVKPVATKKVCDEKER